ncbi:dynein heavy chain [Dorcoceras hygrometricum]|uniref:Dynein heavy chain n=1 Tax=Dorcoceras hygrometricum TaxID=472368 RepID=A0A2Z7ANQ2_9LAMI|nr:dynein heavy chain [Dorcoceras hygrometricum]
MLLSRSADIVLSLQRVFAKKCKRQRFDMLERRSGVHCFVSAEEDFSRLFVEEVQQLLSLFVGDYDTTAYQLRVFSRSIISADALHVVVQQMLYEDS